MKDRRTGPRPDRLFVDSTITGDVEVVTMSTKPGDLGPPITHRPITEADLWETSGVLDASAIPFDPPETIEKVDGVFAYGRKVWGEPVPELSPAEELQREEQTEAAAAHEFRLWLVGVVAAFLLSLALFWPLITRSPLP